MVYKCLVNRVDIGKGVVRTTSYRSSIDLSLYVFVS